MAGLSASTWGDPNATKRVLMLHGITGSSHIWGHIAQGFTSQGYFVIAPDLLGHGSARRGSDYTIAALVEELRPFFTTHRPYDIVVGHSLGGVVAAFLLPLFKSTQPVHVVLVDPPLEETPEFVGNYKKMCANEVRHPRTPEVILRQWPFWTREDAINKFVGQSMCDIAAVEAICDNNFPWSFAHKLSAAPDNAKVTVLIADPSKAPCARMEDLKPYPHVNAKTVWGSSHSMLVEFPQVIVETALEGTEL